MATHWNESLFVAFSFGYFYKVIFKEKIAPSQVKNFIFSHACMVKA
nr:hypothetical protein [Thermodesulfovibrio islandicus]